MDGENGAQYVVSAFMTCSLIVGMGWIVAANPLLLVPALLMTLPAAWVGSHIHD